MGKFSHNMGRIGRLTQNPAQARPGELTRLAESYLSGGQDRRGQRRDFLTLRQERSRSEREICLGDDIHRATLAPGEWVASMPQASRRPQPPKE